MTVVLLKEDEPPSDIELQFGIINYPHQFLPPNDGQDSKHPTPNHANQPFMSVLIIPNLQIFQRRFFKKHNSKSAHYHPYAASLYLHLPEAGVDRSRPDVPLDVCR
jgi:hypothetical protein